jgi:regulator of CtrA degradation
MRAPKRKRCSFRQRPPSGAGYDHLPVKLRDFIDQGDRLFDRVTQLDLLERGKMPEAASGQVNGIADQFSRLHAAFRKTE